MQVTFLTAALCSFVIPGRTEGANPESSRA